MSRHRIADRVGGTLQGLVEQGLDLDVYCETAGCHHHGLFLTDELAAVFGMNRSIEAIRRAMRCTVCGGGEISFRVSIRRQRGVYGHTPAGVASFQDTSGRAATAVRPQPKIAIGDRWG